MISSRFIPALAHRRRACAALLLAIVVTVRAADTPPGLRDSPELAALTGEFPFLGKLLALEQPWEQAPAALARAVFARMPRLAQGGEAYPLLYTDRREEKGWPGESVCGLFAYEAEYHAYDREYPVLKLHLGRPLLFDAQHGRVEALARGKGLAARYPVLDPQVIAPLLARLDQLATSLGRFGAARQPGGFYRSATYLLPNDVRMTVTDLSGSTNGTPYVEITLTPQKPVAKFAGAQTLAFPGAEGAGRFSVGGRGGKVFVVTSLEDYLPKGRRGRPAGDYGQASEHATTLGEGKWIPYVDALGNPHPGMGRPLLPAFPALPAEPVIHGTLREAVEAEGPRYVVFAVSGTIALKSELVIKNPYITIAGQSAPGEGVQIRNWGIEVDTHDVILRHLRIRVGDIKGPGDLERTLGEQTHGVDLRGMNIIVDHCDIAYANDQLFNLYGSDEQLTASVQWCYIYGAPTKSTHEKGSHSMMMLGHGWGAVSFHHNLIAHGRTRNPRLDMLPVDFRNNVIYNFGNTGYGSENDYLRLNCVGNTLKRGPDSKGSALYAWVEKTRWAQWYAEGNRLPADFKGVFDGVPEVIVDRPHPVVPVRTDSADGAFERVVASGGATKPARDAITRWVAQTVRDGTGFIPGSARDWPGGGFASYPTATAPVDQNRNGLPDAWEASRGLPSSAQATGRDLDPRYDNLEVYLNSL